MLHRPFHCSFVVMATQIELADVKQVEMPSGWGADAKGRVCISQLTFYVMDLSEGLANRLCLMHPHTDLNLNISCSVPIGAP